ncbi:CVNH domain-containing protein [Chaetomidium leptoderma]|uniref:CVNH domain-containing protein n=1 Tax=Chaetomidium leptoderma TaxID=669021 RepID=A0AAN6VGI9_9PEZI|nr:CVNH domain-containing protein [Chaetomidium leptoderma]
MRSLVLLASAASLLATAAAVPDGNFSLTCTGVDLFHNFFLAATCYRPVEDGSKAQSQNELDLTMCIGLDQVSGHMQWEVYGKFSNYCTNCTVLAPMNQTQQHLLACFCSPLVGSHVPVKSTINLDEGITNDLGTLKCAGGMASLPHGGRDH